ncbi:MAG: metallophosphoesterase [Cytophagaceae bacterium]|jgi:hypothetical protein|nr:metallophosphoesterase [Cytophagaceae bacterium]
MKGNILAVCIAIVFVILLDVYVFSGLKVLTAGWSPVWRKTIHALYFTYTGFSIVVFILLYFGTYIHWSVLLRTIIFGSFMVWTTVKLLFVLFLLLDDTQRLIQYLSQWGKQFFYTDGTKDAISISRASFIVKAGAVAASIPLVGMTYGILAGGHNYQVRKVTLRLPKLPIAFDGFKIVQLSDIHSGSFYNKTAVQRGIDLVNAQQADVLVFTGDIVNYVASELEPYKEMFAQVTAPMGVYSVLGNHDYGDYAGFIDPRDKQANLRQLIQSHADMGWDLLMNEHRILKKGEDRMALIGIENWGAKGHFPKYGKLAEAYKGTEELPVKILLSHDPSHWDAQVRPNYKDIDVTLSGHTHGFQFGIEKGNIKWSPVQWMYKQWAGLYQEGAQYLYVNRGFGFIGFPGRVGISPEITVIELKSGLLG